MRREAPVPEKGGANAFYGDNSCLWELVDEATPDGGLTTASGGRDR